MCPAQKSDQKIDPQKLVHDQKARESAAAFGSIYNHAILWEILASIKHDNCFEKISNQKLILNTAIWDREQDQFLKIKSQLEFPLQSLDWVGC